MSPNLKIYQKRMKIRRDERRAQVSKMLLDRVSLKDIAEKLGVSMATIAKDRDYLLDQWRQTQAENADAHFTMDLMSLNEAQVAIMDDVRAGHLAHIDRMLKICERRANMLGYDKNKKATGTKEDPIMLQTISTEKLSGMSIEELSKFEEVLRALGDHTTIKTSVDEDEIGEEEAQELYDADEETA
jgi:NADH/NAD ratio-sensing transcriptional regulator Rex